MSVVFSKPPALKGCKQQPLVVEMSARIVVTATITPATNCMANKRMLHNGFGLMQFMLGNKNFLAYIVKIKATVELVCKQEYRKIIKRQVPTRIF